MMRRRRRRRNAHIYGLVLTDFRMPKMNGLEPCGR
jgi:CheY-like chemotaxis protein